MGKLKIDNSFIGTRIEYLSEFDLVGEVNTKELCWCVGVLERISYGTWVKPGERRQCYKENAAEFFFAVQFLRQTNPHYLQLSLSKKSIGIRTVMAHGEGI